MSDTSLYQRLGGAPGIASIVDDILAIHRENPLVKARYQHLDGEALANLKRTTCDFFGAGSGGPETYHGRTMLDTHRGMNISEQEFIAVVDDVLKALEKNGVGQPERNEVLAILYSMKGEIIRV